MRKNLDPWVPNCRARRRTSAKAASVSRAVMLSSFCHAKDNVFLHLQRGTTSRLSGLVGAQEPGPRHGGAYHYLFAQACTYPPGSQSRRTRGRNSRHSKHLKYEGARRTWKPSESQQL